MCPAQVPSTSLPNSGGVQLNRAADFNASLRGRSFEPRKNEKSPSCLRKAWEAIKNFFKKLFCCGCCKTKKSVKSIQNNAPVQRPSTTPILHSQPTAIQNIPSVVPPITPLSLPKPPTLHVPLPKQETPVVQITQNIPTPPPLSTQRPKEKPISIYPPLKELQKLRRENVSYAPGFPPEDNEQGLVPKDFPYLNAVAKALGNPKKSNAAPFLAGMTTYLKQIVNGSCTALSQQENSKYAVMEHPQQLKLVLEFCEQRVQKFAQLNNIEIHGSDFHDQLQKLEEIGTAWYALWDVAQKSYLEQEDIKRLQQCCQELDKQKNFITDYPVIEKKIKALAYTLNFKIFIGNDPQRFNFLGQNVFMQNPQYLLYDHNQRFMERLGKDAVDLLQSRDGVEFDVAHFCQIFDYIQGEYTRFLKAMHACVTDFAHLKLFFPSNNAPTFPFFAPCEPLVGALGLLNEIQAETKSIDQKIALLAEIAQTLPDADAGVWLRFSILKDAMEKKMMNWAFAYFSEYHFENNAADQERKCKIDGAFQLMAQKFGCKEPKMPVIEMDTRADESLQNAENKAAFSKLAQDVAATYNRCLQWLVPEEAAKQAADYLFNHISNYRPEMQQNITNQVIQKLPNTIADAIAPHIARLLFR